MVVVKTRYEWMRIALYVSIPVISTVIYAQPDCVDYIINRWKYIQYPPQATSRDHLRAKMHEIANEDDK